MSDWEVGDYALCVRTNFWTRQNISVGAIYTVEAIWTGIESANDGHIGIAFDLVNVPRMSGGDAYCARAFIKVTPKSADEFDRETIVLMKERVA